MTNKKNRTESYNERLFGKGFRARVHKARFYWLAQRVARYSPDFSGCVELGCYDGKAIDYLPHRPERYLGLDANWEGGLDLAASRWNGFDQYEFRKCTHPDDIGWGDETFDIGICMETFEHIPSELVDPYLERMAAAVSGHIYVSIPVEIGPIFLIKYLVKKLVLRDAHPFTLGEVIASTLGRSENVQRNQHKGFDWRVFKEQMAKHFDIVEVVGYPIEFLPPSINFGVGIVARLRPKAGPA